MLQAHWGYGTKHDDERYEPHLCEDCFFQTCEDCFFQTIAHLKQERHIPSLLSDDGREDAPMVGDDFNLIT